MTFLKAKNGKRESNSFRENIYIGLSRFQEAECVAQTFPAGRLIEIPGLGLLPNSASRLATYRFSQRFHNENNLEEHIMSKEHPVMAPDDIPAIAVGSMNDTHHEEVSLVNTLGALLLQAREGNADEEAIGNALDNWISHTEAHFERENRLMQDHGFPPFPVHAQEHASTLDNLHQLQRQWHENHDLDALGSYVFNTWPQWFQMHVNSMDNVTAQFLSNFVD